MATSETLAKIKALVRIGRVLVSAHGYDELAADGILLGDVIGSLDSADLVEDSRLRPKDRVF